jgi:hypothetical protein
MLNGSLRLLGRYDPWRGQGLLDPVRYEVDDEVSSFVRAASQLDGASRAELRSTINVDAAYTLLGFARRSAVFSLRLHSSEPADDGLMACALVDVEVVDARDVLVALALLDHALGRTGTGPGPAFRRAARLAGDATSAVMLGFSGRPDSERDLRDAWGFVETEGPGGTGLLGWGFRAYAPSLDVSGAIIAIGKGLTNDEYQADDPTLAVELPSVWLRGVDDARVGAILDAAPAGASVSARLRPEVSDDHASQQLTVFLLEAESAEAASSLLTIQAGVRGEFASISTASGSLFLLLIARSFVRDVAHHETAESMRRFEAPMLQIVRRYASG